MHVIVGILVGYGGDLAQIGTAEPQHVFLFLALGFRDHDHGAVAPRIGDQGQADAGIAGRTFDDDASGTKLALGLRILDDGQSRAILHRTARVEEFRLAQDAAAGGLGGCLQLDERRVADAVDKAGANVHGERDYRPLLWR